MADIMDPLSAVTSEHFDLNICLINRWVNNKTCQLINTVKFPLFSQRWDQDSWFLHLCFALDSSHVANVVSMPQSIHLNKLSLWGTALCNLLDLVPDCAVRPDFASSCPCGSERDTLSWWTELNFLFCSIWLGFDVRGVRGVRGVCPLVARESIKQL